MEQVKRMTLANLPTKIEKLEETSKILGVNLYIKRDDQTGIEVSGNKIRKLEYSISEALSQGADTLITCGGIQSNHARATAAIGRKLGLDSHLVLRGSEKDLLEGNYFFDKLLGSEISLISPEDYSNNRMEIMARIKDDLAKRGKEAYIIPEGASNGVGSLGYINALKEIRKQEADLGIDFDAIVVTVGSGGTYAGLFYENYLSGNKSKIYGINICDTADYFKERVSCLLGKISSYTGKAISPTKEDMDILDGYGGLGYGLSTKEEIGFIQEFAKREGIILDPVYTGKAMKGLISEIEKGSFKDHDNILFIHTGGIYGWNSYARSLVE